MLRLPDHALKDHPLVQQERRSLPGLRTEAATRRYRRRVLLIFSGGMPVLWGGMVLSQIYEYRLWQTPESFALRQLLDASSALLVFFFAVSLGAGLLLEVYALATGFRGRQGVALDLLKLAMPAPRLLEGEVALARMRAWRGLLVVRALRLGFLLTLLLHVTLEASYLGWTWPLETDPLVWLAWALLIGWYLLEPGWRMRANTALGYALMRWLRSPVLRYVVSGPLLLLLLFLPAGLALVSVYIVLSIEEIFTYEAWVRSDDAWVFVLLCAALSMFYLAPWAVRRVATWAARRHLQR